MNDRYTGVVMIAGLALAGALSLLRADFSPALTKEFSDGVMQAELQAEFEDNLVHRDGAIAVLSAFRYGLFSEVSEGAVSGHDGWLFTDEEYQLPQSAAELMQTRLDAIIRTSLDLQARGVHLTVALLPDKSRIYPEQVRHPRPPDIEARYQIALDSLRAEGVDAPDLTHPMLIAKNEGQTFLARDTHWTPFGANMVARTLAKNIQSQSEVETVYEMEATSPILHEGDLLDFVRLGHNSERFGMVSEPVAQFDVFPVPSGLGLFDDLPPIEVALVGTSYSADPNWGFMGFLQFEARRDVLNLAQTGVGPFVPMDEVIQGRVLEENPIKIVVWEIPERYLTLEEI